MINSFFIGFAFFLVIASLNQISSNIEDSSLWEASICQKYCIAELFSWWVYRIRVYRIRVFSQ